MTISPHEYDPLAIVVDWLDTCRMGDLHSLVDMYDEQATFMCDCEGVTLIGREAIAAYWTPKVSIMADGAFLMDDVAVTPDGVCLDYRNYIGDPVRLLFRFAPSGKILHTECGALKHAGCDQLRAI